MMSESLDSRKFDRKPLFDVPLPMRRAPRDFTNAAEDSPNEGTATPPKTMAFSLMTKKGNRQQVSKPAAVVQKLKPLTWLRLKQSNYPPTPSLPSL